MKSEPDQIDLLSGTQLNPSAPRSQRMGSVETALWRDQDSSQWEWSDDGWRGQERSLTTLVGVDEAGRGPLAGPVSVAAVVFSPETVWSRPSWLDRLDDSKRLDEVAREALYQPIMQAAAAWSIVHVHAGHIDQVNILQATFQGMAIAVEAALGFVPWHQTAWCDLSQGECPPLWYGESLGESSMSGVHVRSMNSKPRSSGRAVTCLVDGNKRFKAAGSRAADFAQLPVVKGDGLSYHIAAASILAKVSRDAAMVRMDSLYPEYGFAQHKGYPTRKHRAALAAHGPCPHHRISFRGTSA